ncbi:hypothetical protein Cgig2_001619 [Carnegiea gigantea]|uniref:Germin-like protein n=1 Tax=Carnegiea gigantea TaxID=171969 RepID=A0A9Q1JGN4_9CARY|nr:hypothetical protein Cgig2_001619 [Carnegiea gigantea]
MSAHKILTFVGLLAIASYVAYATDPTQLQDFCVGVNHPHDAVFVNGLLCKNPMDVTPEDFLFQGIDEPRSTNNRMGSNVTLVNASLLPGLNALGISVARVDYAPYGGLNAPHIHPRATEVLTVIEGTLFAGFVTSNIPNMGNKFFGRILKKGDVFVFPQGMIHFQFNIAKTPAVAISHLSSQNPGVITIGAATFGSKPPISVDVLSKAFQLNPKVVNYLQSRFQMGP